MLFMCTDSVATQAFTFLNFAVQVFMESTQEAMNATNAAVDIFIGLYVAVGFALLDTGAQHGVIGKPAYEELVERLKTHGLKPRILPTFMATATGVGAVSYTHLTLPTICSV